MPASRTPDLSSGSIGSLRKLWEAGGALAVVGSDILRSGRPVRVKLIVTYPRLSSPLAIGDILAGAAGGFPTPFPSRSVSAESRPAWISPHPLSKKAESTWLTMGTPDEWRRSRIAESPATDNWPLGTDDRHSCPSPHMRRYLQRKFVHDIEMATRAHLNARAFATRDEQVRLGVCLYCCFSPHPGGSLTKMMGCAIRIWRPGMNICITYCRVVIASEMQEALPICRQGVRQTW